MTWLKRLKIDPGLLAAALLATLAAWPFLTRHSLPTLTDAEMHVYRTWQIMEAWKAGVWYLRWAPDFFYGFGYPVFNYYAPLTYYLGAAYGWFFGGPAAGVKFVIVAAAYLGALGMYLFVRDRWGGVAGVVSAAALVLAPYTVFIDPMARGDAPEIFAIALAPLVLWAFSRLRRTASPGDAAVAAVTLAALAVSHNFMGLIFFGLLAAWLAWDVAFGHMFFGAWVLNGNHTSPAARRKVMGMLTLAAALGLGLAAVMWLPAALEREAIQFRNVAGGPGTYFDFHRFFVDVSELFAPAQLFDLGATEMRFRYSLGVAQWALGGLGALSVFSRRTRRLSVLFFAFAAVILVYLVLPGSHRVWETIPPMAFLQFPTRLIGPATVMLAVLAGAAVSWAESPRAPWRGPVFGAVAVAVCIAGAMPLLYPPLWPDFGPVTARRYLEVELSGRALGTTSANDFLPVNARVAPPVQSLIDSYAGGLVDKLNRKTLPAGTTVNTREHGPQHDRFQVSGSEGFVFRLYTYDFPGWTAYVDGTPAKIEPSEPEGWITFWMPAGDHDVLLRLEDTPARTAGWILSGISLAGIVALAGWRFRLPIVRPEVEPLAWQPAVLLGVVVLAGLGLRFLADRQGWWRYFSTGSEVLVAQHQLHQTLEENVALLAYDLPQTTARPGAEIQVTMYWKALAPVALDLRVFVHFIGPDGQLWGQSDKWNPADFPTSRWPLDRYVRDEHLATLRPDAPPGQYLVVAGLWRPDTGARMRVLDPGGQPTAQDGVVLTTTFTVKP